MTSFVCAKPIDAATATLLYIGLATDTGWFRFSNANSAAYATAARLIHAGVRPNELYERLFLCESPARARLIGAIMSSFELLCDDRLAVIKLTDARFKSTGANRSMTEDIINEPPGVVTQERALAAGERGPSLLEATGGLGISEQRAVEVSGE